MAKIIKKFSQIDTLIFDFDGVFTDNCVYTDCLGNELVKCSKTDSLGLSLLKKLLKSRNIILNLHVLTTETSDCVAVRCRKLMIPLSMGSSDKVNDATTILKSYHSDFQNCFFVGNDLNDLDLIRKVHISACPSDSNPLVKQACDIILTSPGGKGAVRDACELFTKFYGKKYK